MLKLFPSELRYVNRVNAILLNRYGRNFQSAGIPVGEVLKHQAQWFTEEQFADYFAVNHIKESA